MNQSDPLDQRHKAKRYALGLLARRARTAEELKTRLQKRSIPRGIITSLIAELLDKGFLDDLEFSVDRIKWRMENSPRGKEFLRWELEKKGVESIVIEQAFSRCSEIINEPDVLRQVLENEFKGKSASEKDKQRILRRLCAHGFEPELVREAVNEKLSFTE